MAKDMRIDRATGFMPLTGTNPPSSSGFRTLHFLLPTKGKGLKTGHEVVTYVFTCVLAALVVGFFVCLFFDIAADHVVPLIAILAALYFTARIFCVNRRNGIYAVVGLAMYVAAGSFNYGTAPSKILCVTGMGIWLYTVIRTRLSSRPLRPSSPLWDSTGRAFYTCRLFYF